MMPRPSFTRRRRTLPLLVALASALPCALPCASLAAQSSWAFAPRAERTTDAIITRDLAWFDSLATASAGGRAQLYVTLARESYERNDDGRLTSALLSAAREPDAALRVHRPDLWAVLSDARRAGLPALEAFEAALVRAQHPLLGAPSCARWEREAERLAAAATQALAARVVPTSIAGTPVPPTPPAPVVLPTAIPDRVHFALDRAELSERSRAVLDVVVDSLARVRDVRIVLEGHTDVRASDAYNADLSERRARAVQAYLVSRGLPTTGITLMPLGRAQPEMPGTTVQDHARNRRVLMRFTTSEGVTLLTLEQREDLQVERR